MGYRSAGEGGMIVTDSEKIFKEALIYRDQGKESYSNNFHIRMGNSWRISEINATIGFYQLLRLDNFINSRRKIAKYYDENLKNVEGLTLIKLLKCTKSNYYKYIVLLDKSINKKEFKQVLMEKFDQGLSGGVYDIPCHLQPIFENKFLGEKFPLAEDVCNRHVCLPMTVLMKTRDAKYVVDSIKSTLQLFLEKK